jgi:hypothetical protein
MLLFTVLLDGREIGTHRFAYDEGVLVSEARFDVRVLGLPVYRYRHQAIERWRGACLDSLVARTDDNGASSTVDWRAREGCTKSFAYWNPGILGETSLLNAQTGELEPVRVTPLEPGRYRIDGRKLAIDLTYEGARWIALETTTGGGRRLQYRLESSS